MNLLKLSRTNTTPFVFVAILYTLFLLIPFFYFSSLKSKPHTSYGYDGNLNIYSKNEDVTDTTAVTSSSQPINKFDEESAEKPTDEESSNTVTVLLTEPQNWKENAESRTFKMLTKIAIFSLICGLGALGAAVSLITRTRNKELTDNNN